LRNITLNLRTFVVRRSFIDWLKKSPEKSRYSLPELCKAAELGVSHLTKLFESTWLNEIPNYINDLFFNKSRQPFEKLLTEAIFSSIDLVSLVEEEPEFFLKQLWQWH
jgi:hypothetical protein